MLWLQSNYTSPIRSRAGASPKPAVMHHHLTSNMFGITSHSNFSLGHHQPLAVLHGITSLSGFGHHQPLAAPCGITSPRAGGITSFLEILHLDASILWPPARPSAARLCSVRSPACPLPACSPARCPPAVRRLPARLSRHCNRPSSKTDAARCMFCGLQAFVSFVVACVACCLVDREFFI